MLSVTVAGRLTKDSVMRFTAEGKGVLGFTVATDVGFGESKHGVFVGVSLWGTRGERLEPYLKKGKSVIVYGQGDLRRWQGDSGGGAEITIKADHVEFQTGSPPGDSKPAENQGFRNKPADKPTTMADFQDSDIPF